LKGFTIFHIPTTTFAFLFLFNFIFVVPPPPSPPPPSLQYVFSLLCPDNYTVYYAVDTTPGVDRVPIRVAFDGTRTGSTGTTHIHHTYDWVNFVTGQPAAALFDVPTGCVPFPQVLFFSHAFSNLDIS
jgi:hypothetical protein